jgi:hypothetical protein
LFLFLQYKCLHVSVVAHCVNSNEYNAIKSRLKNIRYIKSQAFCMNRIWRVNASTSSQILQRIHPPCYNKPSSLNCNSFSTVPVRFLVKYTWHGDALNDYNEVSSLTDEDQDVCCGDKGEVKQFLRTSSQHESIA